MRTFMWALIHFNKRNPLPSIFNWPFLIRTFSKFKFLKKLMLTWLLWACHLITIRVHPFSKVRFFSKVFFWNFYTRLNNRNPSLQISNFDIFEEILWEKGRNSRSSKYIIDFPVSCNWFFNLISLRDSYMISAFFSIFADSSVFGYFPWN